MREIIEIIKNLQSLSGNEQLDYLKSKSDNLVLKEILQYAYNPDLKYKINEAKLNKTLETLPKTGENNCFDINIWNSYKNLLFELSEKKGVKDTDVERVCKEHLIGDSDLVTLFKNILLKDLRINMGVKSFNKVWEDFYFRYPYMGCKSFSMANLSKITYPAFCQTKMDGLFCNAIVDPINKTVEYYSRQGKPIKIKGSLENSLLSIGLDEKTVFNGEVLVFDKTTNRPLPRKITNGIINRDDKTQEELSAIKMVCWDFIPYKHFVKGIWNEPYYSRYVTLKNYINSDENKKILLVDTEFADSMTEALNIFDKKYNQGEEGIVVKNNSQIWKDGKPSGQVKVKAEKDCDLQMVEFIEGKGAYEGMCGSIKCISRDNQVVVYIKPRTPQDAQQIWDNQEKYQDKIVTIKYNEKIKGTSTNKNTYSLYLPVFVEVRTDKSIADSFDEIQ